MKLDKNMAMLHLRENYEDAIFMNLTGQMYDFALKCFFYELNWKIGYFI